MYPRSCCSPYSYWKWSHCYSPFSSCSCWLELAGENVCIYIYRHECGLHNLNIIWMCINIVWIVNTPVPPPARDCAFTVLSRSPKPQNKRGKNMGNKGFITYASPGTVCWAVLRKCRPRDGICWSPGGKSRRMEPCWRFGRRW